MSTRSSDRAEARRRARLAARGELPEEPEEEPQPAAESSGGFLGRLFPPAPALDRPDPLAGFDGSGPLRPLRERAFLLRRNLPAWLITGIIAFVGYLASIFYGTGFLSLVGTFVLFGALIAAGWFGWQRPTLYGTAAAIFSFLLVTATVIITTLRYGITPDAFGPPAEVVTGLAVQGVFQAGLGFIGGWYGGYLRRRQAQLSGEARRRRR